MYLTDEAVTINWEISLTVIDAVVPRSYFDIILTVPDGTSTYLVDPTTGYVAPVFTLTVNTLGNVTYTFTPVTPGLHTVQLVTGTSSDHEVLSVHQLYAVCAPALQEAKVEAYSTNNIVVKEACPTVVPQISLARSVTTWWDIQAIGRHADAGKLVVVGEIAFSNTNSRDIGVLDTATGIITPHGTGALNDAAIIGTNPSWAGIDCDRRTGIYVLTQETTSGGSLYPAYWSTDLTTWTAVTSPSTQFHGNGPVLYDDTHEIWYWNSGDSELFVSDDGKTFVSQNVFYNGFTNSAVTRSRGIRYAAANTLDSNVIIMGAEQHRIHRCDPQTIGAVPVYSTTTHAPGEIQEVVSNLNGWSHSTGVGMIGVGFSPTVAAVMGDSGEILVSETDMRTGEWTVAAEKTVKTNELIDLGVSDFIFFDYKNDSFYAQRSANNIWYRYETEGSPDGTGWVTAGADGFFTWEGDDIRITAGVQTTSSNEVYAVGGYTLAAINGQYVYYDENG